MAATLKRQWFLVGIVLIFALVILDQSASLARAGIFLKNHQGPRFMIFIIFLFSGLIIEPDQIRAGIRDVKATAGAIWVILIVAPLVAGIFLMLPLETGTALGLVLVAAMPTTLSSGVVMTGQAGGSMAHALFTTILSNCLAVVSIPLVLPLLLIPLHLEAGITLDRTAIFIKLLVLVLLPLLLGLGAKRMGLVVPQSLKKRLAMANQCIVLCIVFMSLSGARDVLLTQGHTPLFIVPLAVGFHLTLLGASFGTAQVLKLERGRKESVIFMGAQKTLPLAVMLQITCFPQFGTALLVCVLHHILHLMMDSYLAARMQANNI
ncbi:putative sodium/bile acid symporter family protein [Desulforapulum autotrophicum HRM2]|uniref:Sodium/bile acid symporter family protein n=1 Tax=Desulforapulum autotrophicum (strain ATCC 43914 / DSM 3382 / VKM B-1955 / HRM2) TaxID=177437 RepID=C0Q8Q9_DESAH|nr:bile acid:sodium symporter family protein [Desulforapulum autotrophicum]ACN14399.1 putative sodium/bile acid symporter family protein [Desulforapulum autotrophicum HRM2]